MIASRVLLASFAAAAFVLSGCSDKPKNTKPDGDGVVVETKIGSPLVAASEYRPATVAPGGNEPVTVPLANVVILRKLDLPSKVDGTLLWVGVKTDEASAAKLKPQDVFSNPRDKKIYRRLVPGDYVKRDQVVALLDDEQAYIEFRAPRRRPTPRRSPLSPMRRRSSNSS